MNTRTRAPRSTSSRKRIFAASLAAALLAPISFAVPAHAHDQKDGPSKSSPSITNVKLSDWKPRCGAETDIFWKTKENGKDVDLRQRHTVTFSAASGIDDVEANEDRFDDSHSNSFTPLKPGSFSFTISQSTDTRKNNTGKFISASDTFNVLGTSVTASLQANHSGETSVTFESATGTGKNRIIYVVTNSAGQPVSSPIERTDVDQVFTWTATPADSCVELRNYNPAKNTFTVAAIKKNDSVLTATPSTMMVEDPQKVTGTVTGKKGSGAPTGKVQLTAPDRSTREATLSNGEYEFPASAFDQVGDYSIQYLGSTKHKASNTENVKVKQAPVSIVIPNGTSEYELAKTFTASVTPSSSSGFVAFTIDGTSYPAAPITNGTASLPVPGQSLNVGSHTVKAEYRKAANGPAVSSATGTHIVSPSKALLTIEAVPATPGSGAVPQARVTAKSAALLTEIPDGTIRFGLTGAASPQSKPVSAGSATFDFSGFGNYTSTLLNSRNYVADAATYDLVGADAAFALENTTSVYGDQIEINIPVSPSDPTGSASLEFGTGADVVTANATITSSGVSFSIPAGQVVGDHTVKFEYLGDSTYASTGGTFTHTVTKRPTTASVDKPNIVVQDSDVVVTVAPVGGSATPTGDVELLGPDGQTVTTATLANGEAPFNASNFSQVGQYTVNYLGSANFGAAAPVSVTVSGKQQQPTLATDTIVYSLSTGELVVSGLASDYNGTVSISLIDANNNTTSLGTVAASNGQAQFTLYPTQFPVGTYDVLVEANGTAVYAETRQTYTAGYVVTAAPTSLAGQHVPGLPSGHLSFDINSPAPRAPFGGAIAWTVQFGGQTVDSGSINVPDGYVPVSLGSSRGLSTADAGSSLSGLISADLVSLAPGTYQFTGLYTSADPNFAPSTTTGSFVIAGANPEPPINPAPLPPVAPVPNNPSSGIGTGDSTDGGQPVQCEGPLVNGVCVLGDSVEAPTDGSDDTDTENTTDGKTSAVKGDQVAAEDKQLAATGASVLTPLLMAMFMMFVGSTLVVRRKGARI